VCEVPLNVTNRQSCSTGVESNVESQKPLQICLISSTVSTVECAEARCYARAPRAEEESGTAAWIAQLS